MRDLRFQDALQILQLIDAEPHSDIEAEFDGTRIKVTRRALAHRAETPRTEPVSEAKTEQAKPPVKEQRSAVAPRASGAIEVKPPMAGTFYRSAAPGAAPFVEVDSPVRKGDQLGIVEVMKLFTAVLSPCDGIVRAILVKNEQAVESDQTLILIEPAQQAP